MRKLEVLGLLALVALALACAGCGSPLQRSTKAAFTAKASIENTYISIRRAYNKGDATTEQMGKARELALAYYDAQADWHAELVAAEAEGDTQLTAPGRIGRINAAAAKVTAAAVGLARIWKEID
jgi:hypothetical protein